MPFFLSGTCGKCCCSTDLKMVQNQRNAYSLKWKYVGIYERTVKKKKKKIKLITNFIASGTKGIKYFLFTIYYSMLYFFSITFGLSEETPLMDINGAEIIFKPSYFAY